ncbi:MAG: hypothetical protein D6758_05785 [Gammaproteobacteria bacterium]|nr:MAG: hypothetical protein D6758_05785 [Gammaproteobacteria bacterium]
MKGNAKSTVKDFLCSSFPADLVKGMETLAGRVLPWPIMKSVITRILRYLILMSLPASLAHAIEIVYFWGNNATPPIDGSGASWVTPHPLYMSAAAEARYSRADVGDYSYDHSALSGGDQFSAGVLFKPYGSDTNAVCSLRYVYLGVCRDPSGAPRPTRFLYFWATAEPEEADVLTYGRVDTYGGYPTFYQYGHRVPGAVTRIDTGIYSVKLGGAATRRASVQVQHFDNHGSNINCNPFWWYNGTVLVRCVHRLGFPVDYGFRLVAASAATPYDGERVLFDALTQRSFRPEPILDPGFSQASDGSTQRVSRLAPGYYRVRLGPSANRYGHVQVSSMDYYGAECHVVGFGGGYVSIACSRNGNAVDSPFTVMGVTPYAGANFPRP